MPSIWLKYHSYGILSWPFAIPHAHTHTYEYTRFHDIVEHWTHAGKRKIVILYLYVTGNCQLFISFIRTIFSSFVLCYGLTKKSRKVFSIITWTNREKLPNSGSMQVEEFYCQTPLMQMTDFDGEASGRRYCRCLWDLYLTHGDKIPQITFF